MITRKIARNGMRGRKKVSALLIMVLSFTFLFIVSAILLETSMSETSQNQRKQLYGKWEFAYLGADTATKEQLMQESMVTKTAVSHIVGTAGDFGNVGTITPELVAMGNLKLQQGKLPKKENEILIEASVADSLGIENPVGEKLNVVLVNQLVNEDLQAVINRQIENTADFHDLGVKRRSLVEKENRGDIRLSLESKYCWIGTDGDSMLPEEIERSGLVYQQKITETKEFVICGVMDSYSSFWDTGTFPIANAFITEECGRQLETAIQETGLIDLSDFYAPANLFCSTKDSKADIYQQLQEKYEAVGNPFRKNTYAYPETSGSIEHMLTVVVIAVIFVIAFCAILQIFMTQMKRRTRKIALLKSIGTTNGQVGAMLFWEGIYLLMYSLPIGVTFGFLAGYGAVKGMNRFMDMDLTFYMRPDMLVLGIAVGCLALFAGILIPMIQAMHIPLVGTITVNFKKQKKSARERLGKKAVQSSKALSFSEISRRHARMNRRTTGMTTVITIVTAVIVFFCLYLGYQSFDTYNETVLEEKRPSYVLTAPHGYEEHDLKVLQRAIREDNPKIETNSYRQMNKVYLQYDNIEDSPLIESYKKLLPEPRYRDFIGAEPTAQETAGGVIPGALDNILGSIRTTLYIVEESDEVYQQIRDMVTVGKVDERAFVNGGEVIVAVPMYKAGGEAGGEGKAVPDKISDREMFQYILEDRGGYELSYQEGDAEAYDRDTSLRPGDMVRISRKNEQISEGPMPLDYITYEAKVAGIIYYTPKEKPYPFFADNNGYVVIGSNALLYTFSPEAVGMPYMFGEDRNSNSVGAQFAFALAQCPTKFGQTSINIYTDDGANAVESAARIVKLGKEYGFDFINYNEENWNLYYRALNRALLLGILGGTAMAIAAMILWNINMSSFEQERRRIGVLQALGVTNREFARNYIKTGIRNGVLALLITHVMLAVILWMSGGGNVDLYYYPWLMHILLSVGFLTVIIYVNYGPVRRLKKYAPNENIMS